MSIELQGLVAYPSEPRELGGTIKHALDQLKNQARTRRLVGWEENDVPGRFIGTQVLRGIEESSVFVADISQLNFNVVFEIGYAIGRKKRAFLIRNMTVRAEPDFIRPVGIFDTLGYANYTDSRSLASLITGIADLTPLCFNEQSIRNDTPVFLLLPPVKGEAETHLIARIKKAHLIYRSFDPDEIGRLSAMEAIESVAASHGVVVPLLANHRLHCEVHNFRAAFVAGLAMGMDKLLLLLQSGNDPIPLDYRDLVKSFGSPEQMDESVAEFAPSVVARLQTAGPAVVDDPSTFLARLTLGASAAENEYQLLGKYYLKTDEFRRASRGEVQVVTGRKGAGKTALFFQLRDLLREDKRKVVLDLKPEGFQLLKFKKKVLDRLEEGTREHTITAFWQYLLLLEICHKLIQTDRTIHLRNHDLYKPYQQLASTYASDQYVAEGDFAERMLTLTQRIAEDFRQQHGDSSAVHALANVEITELLYKHDLAILRDHLIAYLKHKGALWILFDNLDKGWPANGVTPEDVLSLRCLLDAMNKLELDFRRHQISVTGIIFVRNDVYENLLEATPDRGKISHVLVDWTEPELLLEILRRRFLCTGLNEDLPFGSIWPQVCISHIRGYDSAHYMVERCLMRPRSLIDFLRFCRSHAVNLGHIRIEEEDIDQGEEKYSTQLVNDISYEMRDVFPPAAQVIYEFIECPAEIDEGCLQEVLQKVTNDDSTRNRILELLLWYGFLGFRRPDGELAFIYSVQYDMRRLQSLVRKRAAEDLIYVINPAFWKGLEIRVSPGNQGNQF